VSVRARGVVFDCDGLLIDSEVRWAVAERRVVEQHGGVWSEELRELLVGGSGENTARCIAESVGLPASAAGAILAEV
jgi:beta-phosphoglucomutase-like phosphatase (HAD superfamily)